MTIVIRLLILAAAGGLPSSPAAADPEPPAAAAAAANDDRIICKKTLETGSLVRKKKQCFTARQWAKIAASQEEGARKLVDDLVLLPERTN